MEGGLGGEMARRFEHFALALVEPEHMKSTPRTSLVLGVLIYPLDYLIRIIRFVLFRIIECGRIYSTSRTLIRIISTGNAYVNFTFSDITDSQLHGRWGIGSRKAQRLVPSEFVPGRRRR